MSRLVFLGTPEVAARTLRALVEGGHDVALVVTAPDRRRARRAGLSRRGRRAPEAVEL